MSKQSAATPIVGRFAPSPSGQLHLGSLRTALAAWLFARSAGGTIYYRVEDVDRGRAVEQIRDQQMSDLAALSLTFDPFEGQPFLSQSTSYPRYEIALDQLRTLLFACSCSRKKLSQARVSLGKSFADDFYPGFCAAKNLPATPPCALRCRLKGGIYCMDDQILGRQGFDPLKEHGPFIVRRADGHFAYQLAVVVDDIFMGVNQVVRGRDILPSTGPQLCLYEVLKQTPPKYAHVPLVLSKASGKKFSKSEGALDYQGLMGRGLTREAILKFLCHSLGLIPAGTSIISPQELVKDFAAQKIIREDTFVDTNKLLYWIGNNGPFPIG